MKIGIDFDNTIVNYETLFFEIASKLGLLPAGIATSKNSVKGFLKGAGRDDEWTKLQGEVYGYYIKDAPPFENCIEVLKNLARDGHEVFIVSHKTKYPYVGEKYDLHMAANRWIENNLLNNGAIRIPKQNITFNNHLIQKIEKISKLGLDVFVDDLVDVLEHPAFPKNVNKIHFSAKDESYSGELAHCSDWLCVYKKISDFNF
ncbi:HAD family hydrolase [Candidatus Ponderosibacter sp. Uisw_141_02]|uniref:HAD family hydrolase n=1 Tax=Candidatus Ponderosibacter sp. Uisw_141_02 TaxID=3231000 RepID=UPI003D39C9EA